MGFPAFEKHRDSLLEHMAEVRGYESAFKSVNRRWEGAITAGLIETGRMQSEAAILFAPLIQDMGATKTKFEDIQSRLVNAILGEALSKCGTRMCDRAQFAIDILKRNLFERTADVGYLSTDTAIVDFLRAAAEGFPETGEAEARRAMELRLEAYQYEYTVYNEILICDMSGRVCASLGEESSAVHSNDPLLDETLRVDLQASGDLFIETFRETDLLPERGASLIYSQKIEDPLSHDPLGVLCLVFDFEGEMDGVFSDLLGDSASSNEVVAILDKDSMVISSSKPKVLRVGDRVPATRDGELELISHKGAQCLAVSQTTAGYQGFLGLPWRGFAMLPVDAAFVENESNVSLSKALTDRLPHFAPSLSHIKSQADDVLADMKLDGLNGQVKAAKFEANGFVEVLRFVNMIGDQIDGVFTASILKMQQTVVTSLFDDVAFRAFQANNIADRNLYERANDVCWWALTPRFRELLAKAAHQQLSQDELRALTDNLQYINDLYTPYLRLVLADPEGTVLAVSDPPDELDERLLSEDLPTGQDFVGRKLDGNLVRQALALESSKDYVVSEFDPSPLYGGRPTYIYSTAVRHPDDDDEVVGVIQIAFDSEPQFIAMLQAALPRDDKGKPKEGCVALFLERTGAIIASSSEEYAPGQSFPVPESMLQLEMGGRSSETLYMNNTLYLVGAQMSEGYREYKRKDGYVNDVLALVLIKV